MSSHFFVFLFCLLRQKLCQKLEQIFGIIAPKINRIISFQIDILNTALIHHDLILYKISTTLSSMQIRSLRLTTKDKP